MDSSKSARPYHLPADAVWFITGCSSGIGQALAKLIAISPNRVVATARNPSSLSAIPDGDNVLKLALDVTSKESIDAALEATLAKFGRIDVLCNNAGYTLMGDTEAAGDAEARQLMDTNFWGVVDATKRALGIMRDDNAKHGGQRGGVIMNTSSIGGFIASPGIAFYHASKWALEGFSESLAKELPAEWNIHLCNIEPGGVKTNYATSSLKMMEKRHPAYANPNFATNHMKTLVYDNPATRESWAEPEALAAAMYKLVAGAGTKRIPIRLPLGGDATALLLDDMRSVQKDLEEFKDITNSVGDSQARTNADEISFLTQR